MKFCPRCLSLKSLDEFSRSSASEDGHQAWCKECFRDYDRERKRAKRRATEQPLPWQRKAAVEEVMEMFNKRSKEA